MTTKQPWLQLGDEAPWFEAQALAGNPAYSFSSAAGRHALLLFFGSTSFDQSTEALRLVEEARQLFDDDQACFFGVTIEPQDARQNCIAQQLPGIRFFLDFDGRVSSLYGALDGSHYHPHWLLLDPAFRVVASYPITQGMAAIHRLRACIEARKAEDWPAPVLVVPNVFEPEICSRLVDLYLQDGGRPSGFMRDVEGKTVEMLDPFHKQRTDCPIDDENLQVQLRARMVRRLSPLIKRAFQFEPTRIERHVVACYEAGAGHFRPHRDNTTRGTAHRQFAVTINLNTGEYEGGDLRFPEFGGMTYRAPLGGAVVFSCSLLHEATPVTSGRRFAYLPFLYDEEGAAIREKNSGFLAGETQPYRAAGNGARPPSS